MKTESLHADVHHNVQLIAQHWGCSENEALALAVANVLGMLRGQKPLMDPFGRQTDSVEWAPIYQPEDLVRIRKRLSLTQIQMAQRLEVSQSLYSLLETGRRRKALAEVMSKARGFLEEMLVEKTCQGAK